MLIMGGGGGGGAGFLSSYGKPEETFCLFAVICVMCFIYLSINLFICDLDK